MQTIMTVAGTRPELIRLSRIIPKLDKFSKHIFVYTGQNYDELLKDIFFKELNIRQPDYHFSAAGTFAAQQAEILTGTETLIEKEKPDKFVVLGDTNSALSAIVAKRMGVTVMHLEAGNRCYDDRVPEEVNRRIIDHCSDIFLPYTERSRQNLIREGIAGEKIFVIGNPIREVLNYNGDRINASKILTKLGLHRGNYFLVTLHRAENVDNSDRLMKFIHALAALEGKYSIPVIVSTHPHTRKILDSCFDYSCTKVQFLEPFGFFDFVKLEQNAKCILTDSGTVQEEAAIFGVPNVILRDTTERPEVVECGSAFVSGANVEDILKGVEIALIPSMDWVVPPEYSVYNTSDRVLKIITSFYNKV